MNEQRSQLLRERRRHLLIAADLLEQAKRLPSKTEVLLDFLRAHPNCICATIYRGLDRDVIRALGPLVQRGVIHCDRTQKPFRYSVRDIMTSEKIRFDHVVGNTAKNQRLACGMSLEQAAAGSKGRVSRSSIATLEEGRGCTSFTLAVLAEVYDCSIDTLAPIEAMMKVGA